MEITALVIMTIFFLFAFMPVSVGKKQAFGFNWLASNRNPVVGKELPEWAQRCERAHHNLKDNFPAFVAAVLALVVTEKTTQGTSIACLVYVVARMGHYLVYGLGSVPLRALCYFTGLFANLYLLLKVIL
jgi:uncharacterized MAPEG superfamily protein